MTPNFYFISEASKSLSVRSRSLKKIDRVENFRVLKRVSYTNVTVAVLLLQPLQQQLAAMIPLKFSINIRNTIYDRH